MSPTTLKALPDGFPHRLQQVVGWNDWFQIPRHVSRVDFTKDTGSATHGWQVRYNSTFKFFSDSIYDAARKHPQAALDAASQYLAQHYAGPKSMVALTPRATKKNVLQEPGLRFVVKRHSKRKTEHYYVEALSPKRGVPAKRFYAGTRNTFSDDKYALALVLARAARATMVYEHILARKY